MNLILVAFLQSWKSTPHKDGNQNSMSQVATLTCRNFSTVWVLEILTIVKHYLTFANIHDVQYLSFWKLIVHKNKRGMLIVWRGFQSAMHLKKRVIKVGGGIFCWWAAASLVFTPMWNVRKCIGKWHRDSFVNPILQQWFGTRFFFSFS